MLRSAIKRAVIAGHSYRLLSARVVAGLFLIFELEAA